MDLSGIVGKDFNECMKELVKVENDLGCSKVQKKEKRKILSSSRSI